MRTCSGRTVNPQVRTGPFSYKRAEERWCGPHRTQFGGADIACRSLKLLPITAACFVFLFNHTAPYPSQRRIGVEVKDRRRSKVFLHSRNSVRGGQAAPHACVVHAGGVHLRLVPLATFQLWGRDSVVRGKERESRRRADSKKKKKTATIQRNAGSTRAANQRRPMMRSSCSTERLSVREEEGEGPRAAFGTACHQNRTRIRRGGKPRWQPYYYYYYFCGDTRPVEVERDVELLRDAFPWLCEAVFLLLSFVNQSTGLLLIHALVLISWVGAGAYRRCSGSSLSSWRCIMWPRLRGATSPRKSQLNRHSSPASMVGATPAHKNTLSTYILKCGARRKDK